MSQYLLINRIQVQGANAVAGFTWGFPSITHFLGYTHNLSRKLSIHADFSDIQLSGCAVIAHQHQVHTYGFNQFVQSKNPAYLKKDVAKVKKGGAPSIIEEGKMNLTVSLLIQCDGNIGNRKEALIGWLNKACQRQRLAGGTVLEISEIDFYTLNFDEQNRKPFRTLIRKLLPGFVLQDRSDDLAKHFQNLKEYDSEAELFDAWLDFIALKQKARPVCDLINNHLIKLLDLEPENHRYQQLQALWQKHLEKPYDKTAIPETLKGYFSSVTENKTTKKLLTQWQAYSSPTEKTEADWEYIEKPRPGFLVPIMVGYKAISPLYKNNEIANTRDNETDVCFVEAVHSIGEWQSVHRIRSKEALNQTLWDYQYEKNWYLCKQAAIASEPQETEPLIQNPENDF